MTPARRGRRARAAAWGAVLGGFALFGWLGVRLQTGSDAGDGTAIAPAPDFPDAAPVDDPLARYGLPWTADIPWERVVDVADVEASSDDERVDRAQAMLAGAGGVLYFAPGVYRFNRSIRLRDGVVLRGPDPVAEPSAVRDGYELRTRFEFPRFVPTFDGAGTPIEDAFEGIELEEPGEAANVGIINIELRHGHIDFGEGPDHAAGRNRFVFGCVLRAAAVASRQVPDRAMGQHAWQRYTDRTHAAIQVFSGENALVANNRLPSSSDHNFVMPGYRLHGRGPGREGELIEADVVFDYDNRPGIYVNPYDLGGRLPDDPPSATPASHPHGFREGVVIRDNFIFSSGRPAILFTGHGTVAAENVIRFRPEVTRWTNTGLAMAWGDETNSARAIEMRGWGWRVERNDFEVYRNRAADSGFFTNDGEGLLHEAYANSAVRDAVVADNVGNAPISIYKTGRIDGLEVRGNRIRIDRPERSNATAAIFVVADRADGRGSCTGVRILDNRTAGLGLRLACHPGTDNVIAVNRHRGGGGQLVNHAGASLRDNHGYSVVGDAPPPRVR